MMSVIGKLLHRRASLFFNSILQILFAIKLVVYFCISHINSFFSYLYFFKFTVIIYVGYSAALQTRHAVMSRRSAPQQFFAHDCYMRHFILLIMIFHLNNPPNGSNLVYKGQFQTKPARTELVILIIHLYPYRPPPPFVLSATVTSCAAKPPAAELTADPPYLVTYGGATCGH